MSADKVLTQIRALATRRVLRVAHRSPCSARRRVAILATGLPTVSAAACASLGCGVR